MACARVRHPSGLPPLNRSVRPERAASPAGPESPGPAGRRHGTCSHRRHPHGPAATTARFHAGPPHARRPGGPQPPAWALYRISQMVDALGAVWQAGVVHRDLKPDNILVGPAGVGKLIDFGLAKAGRPNPEGTEPELAGTAAYIAPEQAKDA